MSKRKNLITTITLVASVLTIIGIFMEAAKIAVFANVSYWQLAGNEKYFLLGAVIACAALVLTKRHALLPITALIAVISPFSPMISFESEEHGASSDISSMFSDTISAVTDPVLKTTSDFALDYLIDFSPASICFGLGLLGLLTAAFLTLKRG